MNSIIHPADDSSRLTLALLLALALHVVLIFAIPAEHWSLPKIMPLRFEAVLLPPVASPPIIEPERPTSVQPTETQPSHSPMSLPAALPPLTPIPPDTTEPTSTTPPASKPPLPLESASLIAAKPKSTPQQQAEVLASRNLRSASDQPKPSTRKPTPKKPVIATPPTSSPAVSTRTATRPTGRAAAANVATTSRPKSATSLAKSSPRLPSFAETAVITPSAKSTSAAHEFASPGLARQAVRAEDFPAIKSSPNKISSTNRSNRDRVDSSALLGQVASLEAETQRRATAGTRNKRVNPNDMQSLEGFYIAAWVRKVERIGEMNFPEAARQGNSSRGPILDVSIRADGSIQAIRVVRSSGNNELDQAAQRIVRLGAPYAAFSPELRQKYDVISISRPWRFEPSGQIRMR